VIRIHPATTHADPSADTPARTEPTPQHTPQHGGQQRREDQPTNRAEQEGPVAVPEWAAPQSTPRTHGPGDGTTEAGSSQPPSGTATTEAPGGPRTNAKDAPLSGQATLLLLGLVYAAWTLAGNQDREQ